MIPSSKLLVAWLLVTEDGIPLDNESSCSATGEPGWFVAGFAIWVDDANEEPEASLGSDLNGINFSVSHCVAVMNHAMTSCR